MSRYGHAAAAGGSHHRKPTGPGTPTPSVGKLIGFHYFPPYPLSFRGTADNPNVAQDTGTFYDTSYLVPGGSGSGTYGSLLRDRPPPGAVLPGTYANTVTGRYPALVEDQKVEIARMIAAGANMTWLEGLSFTDFQSRNWQICRAHLDAAAAVDPSYRVLPILDLTNGNPASAQQTAAAFLDLAGKPAILTVGTTKLLAQFTPESNSQAYWNDVDTALAAGGLTDYAWVWCLQDWTQRATWAARPKTYALSQWGNRSPASLVPVAGNGNDAHALGKKWFAPAAIQDERPNQAVYDEPVGSQVLRTMWAQARATGADGVQRITWNDYSEGTQQGPSGRNADSWVALARLHQDWYSSGVKPTPTVDTAWVIHRTHHTAASLPAGRTRMSLRSDSSPTVNLVEFTCWLTGPATAVTTVGGVSQAAVSLSAGENVWTVPIGTGTSGSPSITVSRGGSPVLTVTSRNSITTSPAQEDLSYYATHGVGAAPAGTALSVAGGRIVAADGRPVVLRGANFMSHEHRGQTTTIAAGLAAMRTGWGGNLGLFGYASRAVMNNTPHPYSGTPYLTLLDQIVAAAKANGCYVVLAARWSGIEGRDTDSGSPTQTQYPGIPPQEAIDSLAKLATRYLSEPRVMFACQVETNGNVTWAQARDYYQACLNAVRATTSQAIVMSSGLDSGKTINGAVANPVVGSGFVYKTHIYERQSAWAAQFTAAVDAGLPVFIGEFGQPADFGEPYVMTQTEVGQVLAYASAHGIGWAGWAFEAGQSPSMVTDETAFGPTDPFGLSLRNEMLKTPPTPGDPELAVAPTPLGLTGVVQSDTQIGWSWGAVAGVVRYEYRVAAGTPVSTGTTASFSQTVTAGSSIALQVRSVTAAGTSAWSPAVTRTASGGLSISRAKPITASTASYAAPIGVLVDGQWDADSFRSTGYPVVVTLDLSTVPTGQLGPVSIGWAMDAYNSDNVLQDAQYDAGGTLVARGTTYNEPGAYTFQGATSSAGPWTTLVTVTDNTNRSRTHRADLTGYTWLRWNLTAGNPGNEPQYNNQAQLSKLEVIAGAATDSWLFTGDSITCAGAQVSNGLGSKVEALAAARKPLIQPLGIPGSRAIDFAPGGTAAYRTRWLAWLTETACTNVTINLGTNDAGYAIPAATFNTALRALIADVTSRGKVPWLPTIPWNSVATANVQALNAVIAQIYTDLPAVQRGPDLYAYFAAHPTQIEATSPFLHPTAAGYAAWSDLWAQTLAGTAPGVSRSGSRLTVSGVATQFPGFNCYGIGGGDDLGTPYTDAQVNAYLDSLRGGGLTRTWGFQAQGIGQITRALNDAQAKGRYLLVSLGDGRGDANDSVVYGYAKGTAKPEVWYQTGYTGTGNYRGWVDTVTKQFKDHPALAGFEIINEPLWGSPSSVLRGFYDDIAALIKTNAPGKLVFTGQRAEYDFPDGVTGWKNVHASPSIDVCCLHEYDYDASNRQIVSSHYAACAQAAYELGKPIIVGEVGIRVPGSLSGGTTQQQRADAFLAKFAGYFGHPTYPAAGVLIWNRALNGNLGDPNTIYQATDPVNAAVAGYTAPGYGP